jgi:hypothetical protein
MVGGRINGVVADQWETRQDSGSEGHGYSGGEVQYLSSSEDGDQGFLSIANSLPPALHLQGRSRRKQHEHEYRGSQSVTDSGEFFVQQTPLELVLGSRG